MGHSGLLKDRSFSLTIIAMTTGAEDAATRYLDVMQNLGATVERRIPGSEHSLQNVDGLLLTGGPDVDPKLYGEELDPEAGVTMHQERDGLEFSLLQNALEKDIKFIKKRTLKWFKSSKKARRGFCNKCGASIFFKFLGSDDISIAAGMFQNPTKLKTTKNIFVKGKLDYYKLPKFSRYSK